MLLTKILITALLGGIAALDKYSILLLISEPLIICSAAGAYFNDLQSGLLVGIIWQLMWIGELPIGAADDNDSSVGSIVSAVLYLNLRQKFPELDNLLLTVCIICGIAAAYISGEFIADKRRLHSKYSSIIEGYAVQPNPAKIESVFALGLAEQFVSGALSASLIFLCFYFFLGWSLKFIPLYWEGLFKYILPGIWGLLSALLINHFLNRKTLLVSIIGLAAGFLLVKFF